MSRRYLAPTFLGAFLLFALQPMAGKRVLPLFGGGPAVWTTCMLLFQVLLLAGYAYSHFIATRLSRRAQAELHIAMLLASLAALLRIGDPEAWIAASNGDPVVNILLLLLGTIGFPYFMLASTAPLIQSWARVGDASPYRLYALSNAASFLALISYPFLVEPWISLRHQFWIWSILYFAFAIAMTWCARPVEGAAPPQRVRVALQLRPALYAACGSAMLLAVTNQMCQEVAVVPFLWILPLALYLLTFTICFDRERWYDRRYWSLALAVLAPVACAVLALGIGAPLIVHIVVDTLVLVAGCMICHGELARSKPAPEHLTGFYLAISAGGAIGGVLVAIVAPRVFTSFTEFPLAMAAAALLALDAWRRTGAFQGFSDQPMITRSAIAGVALAGMVAIVAATEGGSTKDLRRVRNFYGILHVSDVQAGPWRARELAHGRILHGFQFLDADKQNWATTYFGSNSGIGLAMRNHPRRLSSKPALKIGVIGLGIGTIAAHGWTGDTIRFYEINPAVDELSRDLFTFRRDSNAHTSVALGDARVVLSRETPGDYDILAVDAFSSDAIPAHLLTAQCADLYRRHLKPDGVLLFHISNRSLDLAPVVRALAARLGWQAGRVINTADDSAGIKVATWMIVSGNQDFWDDAAVKAALTPFAAADRAPLLWTDDFTSLWRVLK